MNHRVYYITLTFRHMCHSFTQIQLTHTRTHTHTHTHTHAHTHRGNETESEKHKLVKKRRKKVHLITLKLSLNQPSPAYEYDCLCNFCYDCPKCCYHINQTDNSFSSSFCLNYNSIMYYFLMRQTLF